MKAIPVFPSQRDPVSLQLLPFSYSLVPRTFSKCVEMALKQLGRKGIRVLFYLDDLIVMASFRETAGLHTAELSPAFLSGPAD